MSSSHKYNGDFRRQQSRSFALQDREWRPSPNSNPLGIINYLRRRSARLKLCAHLLQAGSKSFNLLLLLSNNRFQVLHLMMLFEELVEQHRVYRFVAHGVELSFFIPHHQVRIDLFYFFGHKTELRDALRINLLLVTEGDWLKREDRFAGLSIGLISSLNRREDVAVPSLPFELMNTAVPPEEVAPKIWPI